MRAGDVMARVIERRGDRGTDPPVVVGYAATFFNAVDPATEYQLYEDIVEHIMPGCFDRACREDDVRALFNHNVDFVLGRSSSKTLKLSVDKVGLRYEIQPPNTQAARDVCELIRRQDVSGSSFSFIIRSQKWTKAANGMTVRELLDVSLQDVGPVTVPAYEATSTKIRDDVAFGGGIPVSGGSNSRPVAGERRLLPAALARVRLL